MSSHNPQNTFSALQERLLDQVLLLVALVLTPSSLLLITRSSMIGWSLNSTLQLTLYITYLILLLKRRKFSYLGRTYLLLTLLWLSGTLSLFLVGPLLENKSLLFVLTLFSMLFLPTVLAWLMVGLGSLLVITVGILVFWYDWHFLEPLTFFQHPITWLLGAYHYIALSAISAYIIWQMVNNLRSNLEHTQLQSESLHFALSRQQAIFSSSNAAIAIIKARRFVEINTYLASLLGYSKEELINQPTRLLYHSDQDYERFGQQVYQHLASHGNFTTEYPFRHKSGKEIWTYLSVSLLPSGKNTLSTEIVLLAIDISHRKQVESALQESELRFRQFADNTDAVFWIRTPDKILYINQAYEKLWGRSRESLYLSPNSFIETIHPDDRLRIIQASQIQAEYSSSFDEVYRIVRPNGDIRWIHARGYPVPGPELRFTGIANDITQRKVAELHLKASEQRLKRLGDNLPEGAIHQLVHSVEGKASFTYISAGIERILGITSERVLTDPMHLYKLIHPEDLNQVLAAELESKRQLTPFDQVVRHYTINGELRWLYIRSTPYRKEDGSTWWDGFAMDITRQKQIERELIQARESAETANRAKSAFIANMSHELRTPLNAILGFAQILMQDSNLNEIQRNQVHSIQRGGEYLLTLISDILDLAKIEAGYFDLFPETCDTHSLFHELNYMFEIRATQKSLYFQYETATPLPYAICCDNKRLRQILLNLLSNAIKFTECGTVTLRTGYSKHPILSNQSTETEVNLPTDQLWIEVTDSGIGIAPEDIDKIFQPFQQTGSTRYRAQGTGLGLSITYRLVEAMGGKLQVNSTLGKGSTFRVEIPVSEVITDPQSLPSPTQLNIIGYQCPTRNIPLCILEVDDETDNRLVLRYLLEPLGFTLIDAENGQRCLELLQEENCQPDIILMDLRMPKLDGLQTTRILRSRGFNLPIIVLSAANFAEDRAASSAAGSNAHLAKPVHLPELLNTLQQLLPLEWEYSSPLPQTDASTPEVLNPEQLTQFLYLTEIGDMDGLEIFAQQLRISHPYFSKKLSLLANAFELGKIYELAREYGSTL